MQHRFYAIKEHTERRNLTELNYLTNWPMGKQGESIGHCLTRT